MKDITDFNVEDFAHEIYNKKISKSDINNILIEKKLTKKEKDILIEKYNYAFKRINSSLGLEQKILFFLIPFGFVNRLYSNEIFNVEKNLKLGFYKKNHEYEKYSFYGIFFYILLIVIFLLF